MWYRYILVWYSNLSCRCGTGIYLSGTVTYPVDVVQGIYLSGTVTYPVDVVQVCTCLVR